MYANKFQTKQGKCLIIWSENGLSAIVLPNAPYSAVSHNRYRLCDSTPDWVEEVKNQITAYFEGQPQALEALKKVRLDFGHISPFRRKVYEKLRTVKPGEIITYNDLASNAGAPGAARAVGTAMAKNPFPLLVPCHRVVKSDGTCGNYSALSGTKSKIELLKMEQKKKVQSGPGLNRGKK